MSPTVASFAAAIADIVAARNDVTSWSINREGLTLHRGPLPKVHVPAHRLPEWIRDQPRHLRLI